MTARLLTPAASSPKLAHGLDKPIEAAVLYLAPYTIGGGQNVCPMASPACAHACLNTAGRGGIGPAATNTIQQARIRKTQWLQNDPETFLEQLVREIAALERRAIRNGKRPAIRLNGTSDIAWERIPVTYQGMRVQNIMTAFPNVTFYDYTKVVSRIRNTPAMRLPSNYVLTFSLSESNDRHALEALENGINVAVVLKADGTLPSFWSGYCVVDGDAHDYRFIDPQGGNIIALTPKGKARQDTTGFVRHVGDTLEPSRTPRFAAQLAQAAD